MNTNYELCVSKKSDGNTSGIEEVSSDLQISGLQSFQSRKYITDNSHHSLEHFADIMNVETCSYCITA